MSFIMDFVTKWARVLIGSAILVILLLGFLQLRSCQQSAQRAAQGRVDEGQAGAFKNSAADAINTQGVVTQNAQVSEELSLTNTKEIRDAEGAGNSVSPAVNDAFLRAACRRASSRNDPKCRLLQPHP